MSMSRSSVTVGVVRGHRRHHALAGGSPVVVLVVGVAVRDAAVDDHQRQLVGQRHRAPLGRAAVEEQGAARRRRRPRRTGPSVRTCTPTWLFSAYWAIRATSSGPTAGPPGAERAQAVTTSSAAEEDSPEPMGRLLTSTPSKPPIGWPVFDQGPGRAGDVVVPGVARGGKGSRLMVGGLAVVVAP